MKIENIKAVIALKIIKETFEEIGLFHLSIIPDVGTRLMIINDDLRFHLEVIQYKNRYILRLEEIEVTNKDKGLGSLLFLIMLKTCEEVGCVIGLWTTPYNKEVEKWYKKLGFRKEKKLKNNHHIWWENSPNKKCEYDFNKIDKELIKLFEERVKLNYEFIQIKNEVDVRMQRG